MQGLGACLTEAVVHDEDGQLLQRSLLDYALLTSAEIPPFAPDVVETPSPLNPLGFKGVGEGGAIGSPRAVANALADALGGRRVVPPFTAEKLWRALRDRPRGGVGLSTLAAACATPDGTIVSARGERRRHAAHATFRPLRGGRSARRDE